MNGGLNNNDPRFKVNTYVMFTGTSGPWKIKQ